MESGNKQALMRSDFVLKFLIGIGVILAVLVVFKAGEFVGAHKASFSYRWGENYYNSVVGPRRGMPLGFDDRDFLSSNGTTGTVAQVGNNSFVVQTRTNVEKVVLVSNSTVIRKFQSTITLQDIHANDHVVVLGSSNSSGQIVARLIRVFPAPTSSPVPSGSPQPSLSPKTSI